MEKQIQQQQKKIPKDIMNMIIIKNQGTGDSQNKCVSRDRRYKSLILMPPPKAGTVQKYYESLSEEWYKLPDVKLWNWTINPDPKKIDKKWSNKQIENFLVEEVANTFCSNKLIRSCLLEYVMYFEIGEKNGKFHVNVCTKWKADTEDRITHIIKDKMTTKFGGKGLNLKNQKRMPEYDHYNCKDAGYMSAVGHKPRWYKIEQEQDLEIIN